MKIEFLFIGKTTDSWIKEGCENYLQRINRYVKADINIINSPNAVSSPSILKDKEAASVLKMLSGKDYVVLLDEKGKNSPSEEFSIQLNKMLCSGKTKIVFIIGGAYGADTSLGNRADLILSFSKMTFTRSAHQAHIAGAGLQEFYYS